MSGINGNGIGNWTDERVDLLKKLWADGYSCSVIAAEIGGITRNAVIGKVTRLGLPFRKTQKDGRPRGQRWKECHRSPGRRRFVFPTAPVLSGVASIVHAPKSPDHLGLTFDQLKPGLFQCRYIDGDVREGTHTYCGQPTLDGSSYCAFHHRICYTRPDNRKPFTAEGRAA